jgi:hypothetical protein
MSTHFHPQLAPMDDTSQRCGPETPGRRGDADEPARDLDIGPLLEPRLGQLDSGEPDDDKDTEPQARLWELQSLPEEPTESDDSAGPSSSPEGKSSWLTQWMERERDADPDEEPVDAPLPELITPFVGALPEPLPLDALEDADGPVEQFQVPLDAPSGAASEDDGEELGPRDASLWSISLPSLPALDEAELAVRALPRAELHELRAARGISRFHLSYCVVSQWARIAPFADALLAVGSQLHLVHPDGSSERLAALPERAVQLLINEPEGWALIATAGGALWRLTLGTWHAQLVTVPPRLTSVAGCRLVWVDDHPKLLTAGGALWDVVARATQLVRNPYIHPLLQVSEPSGEFGVAETQHGLRLVRLTGEDEHASIALGRGQPSSLCSAAGRLALCYPNGELWLYERPESGRPLLTLPGRVRAMALGTNQGETLLWAAVDTPSGQTCVLEVDTTGATEIHRQELPDGKPRDVQLVWSANARTLYLHEGARLVALKRLEA